MKVDPVIIVVEKIVSKDFEKSIELREDISIIDWGYFVTYRWLSMDIDVSVFNWEDYSSRDLIISF